MEYEVPGNCVRDDCQHREGEDRCSIGNCRGVDRALDPSFTVILTTTGTFTCWSFGSHTFGSTHDFVTIATFYLLDFAISVHSVLGSRATFLRVVIFGTVFCLIVGFDVLADAEF